MKKLILASIMIFAFTVISCNPGMEYSEFDTIKKEVIGELVLDVFASLDENIEDLSPLDNEFSDEIAIPDSLIRMKIAETAKAHETTSEAFFDKASELGIDIINEIELEVVDITIMTVGATAVKGIFITFSFENWDKTESQIDSMLNAFMWSRVDTFCRMHDYIPKGFSEKLDSLRGE